MTRLVLCTLAVLFCIVISAQAQEFIINSTIASSASWDDPAIWVNGAVRFSVLAFDFFPLCSWPIFTHP